MGVLTMGTLTMPRIGVSSDLIGYSLAMEEDLAGGYLRVFGILRLVGVHKVRELMHFMNSLVHYLNWTIDSNA